MRPTWIKLVQCLTDAHSTHLSVCRWQWAQHKEKPVTKFRAHTYIMRIYIVHDGVWSKCDVNKYACFMDFLRQNTFFMCFSSHSYNFAYMHNANCIHYILRTAWNYNNCELYEILFERENLQQKQPEKAFISC